MSKFALVTGCSKGIGYEYCRQLLSLGYDIIGVSRNTTSLIKLKKIYQHRKIIAINVDLSDMSNVYNFFNQIKKYDIHLVFNNAGFGDFNNINNIDIDTQVNMIDLNIKALHILTLLFLKEFIKRDYGRIINIASIVAFWPLPLGATYAGTKAFVRSISIAYNTELIKMNSKVRVLSVLPGPTVSSFGERSHEISTEKSNALSNEMRSMPTDVFCSLSLKQILKAKPKANIVVGAKNRFLTFMLRFIPTFVITKMSYKLTKKFFDSAESN